MLGLDEVAPVPDIEDALDDLHNGRRGFIISADHASKPISLALGSKVFLAT
jgi:hypothetical protein